MREIKFRAWDTENHFMVDQDVISGIGISPDGIVAWIDVTDPNITIIEPAIMQYTGLHDCNGKEIYEGDIVQDEMADGRNIWAIITCDLEQWEEPFCYGNDNAFCYKGFLELIARERIEVIGNIYMNPELVGNLNK